MKICFIGSNGFLSTAFGKYFGKVDIYGTNTPKYYLFNCFNQYDIIANNYAFDQFLEYDFIFLFSALGVQSGTIHNSKDIFKINTFFPIELFNFLSQNNHDGTLVTFGSYFEIGFNKEEKHFSENELINSMNKVPNDYCMSKRLLTKYIDSIDTSLKYWHFILPTIYGAGENQNRLIPFLINEVLKKREISLTSGFQVRDYLHVEEIPKIINMAIEKRLDSGIYNLSGNEKLSVKELVIKVISYFDYPVRKVNFGAIDRNDTQMLYLSLNANKLYNQLNYFPESSITQKLKDY